MNDVIAAAFLIDFLSRDISAAGERQEQREKTGAKRRSHQFATLRRVYVGPRRETATSLRFAAWQNLSGNVPEIVDQGPS
ncbi:MAG TPA: hypothetical protein VFO69_05535 [Allosphingosinicella sp.]|nr:hypothetical protein [Allosphingosinicella sp.]